MLEQQSMFFPHAPPLFVQVGGGIVDGGVGSGSTTIGAGVGSGDVSQPTSRSVLQSAYW